MSNGPYLLPLVNFSKLMPGGRIGSVPYSTDAFGTIALVPPNTTTNQYFLAMTGDGTNGAAPVWAAVSGGSGTVTSFSSGGLSPLFTTSVATPTSTPALSFSLSNVSSGTFLGRTAVGSGAPSYTAVTDAVLSLSDITTNNASTSNHGFLLKLDNTATHYMDGTGNWSTPSGSGGTVTSFSSGSLSPIFTTSVANATTTPALSFSLSTAGSHAFLGNNTGSSATPAYVQPSFTDLAGSLASSQDYNVGTAGTYGDATHFPVVTTNAQGRVSAVTTNSIPTAAYSPGGAMDFLPVNTASAYNYFSVASNSDFQPTTGITVSFWLYQGGGTTNTSTGIFYHGAFNNSDFGNYYIVLNESARNITFGLNGTTSAGHEVTGQAMSTGKWHLVTCTYDKTTQIVYIDGNLSASSAFSTSITTSANSTYLGIWFTAAATRTPNAIIDDVRYYKDTALTQAQIVALQNGGIGMNTAGSPAPTAWWKLDDGFGQSTYVTTAADSSGNSHTLSLTNSATTSKSAWVRGVVGQ